MLWLDIMYQVKGVSDGVKDNINKFRDGLLSGPSLERTYYGGGGLNILIFMLCPIDFFSNQVDFKRN